MTRRLLTSRLFILQATTWMVLLSGIFFGSVKPSAAQSSLDITNITVSNRTANAVTIDVSTTIPAEVRILYGKTTAYGSFFPADQSFIPNQGGSLTTSMIIGGLSPSTNYHFKVEVQKDGVKKSSSDRTFVTTSGSSSGAKLLITDILADCTNASCRIRFSTTQPSHVILKWGQSNGDYPNTVQEDPTPPDGPYRSGARALVIQDSSFATSPNKNYHYILEATDATSQLFTTGDLSFTLSNSSIDHVFTTGACPDGTAINSCNASGAFCRPGGVLEYNCAASCGFVCPSGQTCTGSSGSGLCLKDPSLNGAPSQCNRAECYGANGQLSNPVPSGCYASWPKCNANTILKVRKDRGCNLWLSCATSVQTEATAQAPAQNLCLSLAACNSLNQQGQCNKYLPQGQCDNNPLRFCSKDADCEAGGSCNLPSAEDPTRSLQDLTFTSPDDIKQIANLSGNVVAGLDWSDQGGSAILKGMLPWQLMRQIGGNAQISDADFENADGSASSWSIVPSNIPFGYQSKMSVDFEDRDNSFNHVLTVTPVALVPNPTGSGRCSNNITTVCTDDNQCGAGNTCSVPAGTCTNTPTKACNRKTATTACDDGDSTTTDTCSYPDTTISFPGVASNKFTASPTEYYYGEVRVRATPGRSPKLRVQFGSSGYTRFSIGTTPTFVDITATEAWQRVSIGPIKGMGGDTQLAVVCLDTESCDQFQIDDVLVKPVLQVNTNPDYLTSTCRLFPKNDSPSCDYKDANGTSYRGWRGYCLEQDSQTGTCLSWWPVDIIKGETSIFGTDTPVGYSDQSPLYMCAESAGKATPDNDFDGSDSYTIAKKHDWRVVSNCDTDRDAAPFGNSLHLCMNEDVAGLPTNITYFDLTAEKGLRLGEIDSLNFEYADSGCANCTDWPQSVFRTQEDGSLLVNQYEWSAGAGSHRQAYEQTDSVKDTRFAGKCSSEPCIVWKDEPVRPTTDQTGNQVGFYLIFNSLGQAEKLGVWGNDESGDVTEGVSYRIVFRLRDVCNKLVQVVEPGGRTRAFSARVASNAYKVPAPVSYSRSTDLSPYGAALPPADLGDTPTQWPLLSAQAANYNRNDSPGQARSGSPYACNGKCDKKVCNINPANFCDTTAKVLKCQSGETTVYGDTSDVDGDGIGDGQCIGVGNDAISNQGSQTFSPAIDPTAIPSSTPQACAAVSTKQCAAVTNGPAVSQTVFGTGPTAQNSARAKVTLACQGKIVDGCDGRSNACSGGSAVKYSGATFGSSPCSSASLQTTCTGRCVLTTAANYSQAATTVTDRKYFAEQYLRRLFTQSYGVWQFRNGKYEPVIGSDYNSRTTGGFVGWNPPTEICPKGDNNLPTRPAYPNDYCAVPPSIIDDPNIDTDGPKFLSGDAHDTVITGGSGSVGIRFNTQANPDQLPLEGFTIDWGDTQDTFSYPYAPKSDTRRPHIFSHAYVCDGGVTCTYQIKIQVKDNWGWCNDAVKRGDAADVDDVADKQCQDSSASWYNTGLKVIVRP